MRAFTEFSERIVQFLDPSKWHEKFPNCGMSMQSPIDIKNAKCNSNLKSSLTFTKYDKPGSQKFTLENNGHTLVLLTESTGANIELANVATFKLIQLHFHWGSDNTEGSEHKLKGKAYPAEVSALVRRTALLSQQTARTHRSVILTPYFNSRCIWFTTTRNIPRLKKRNRRVMVWPFSASSSKYASSCLLRSTLFSNSIPSEFSTNRLAVKTLLSRRFWIILPTSLIKVRTLLRVYLLRVYFKQEWNYASQMRVCLRGSSTLMSWSNENKSCMRVDKRGEFAWEFRQLSCPGQTRTRVAWELASESLHESWQARVCMRVSSTLMSWSNENN